MKQFLVMLGVVCGLSLAVTQAKSVEPLIVDQGKSNAEIILSESPPRSTRLAAAELQTYLAKITGAIIPIATVPSEHVSVQIYIGESRFAAQQGITVDGLECGAYRIVSGKNWLALIGDDDDFSPIAPWARNNSERGLKLQSEWEDVTGIPFGVPNGGLYKFRQKMPDSLAKQEREYLWQFDERGSFNAVCGYLRGLGVRWYMPGELGEIVPTMKSISLPEIDQIGRPDFDVRQMSMRFATVDDEVMWWAMRLGIRHPYGLMIAHGMHTMTHPDRIKTLHPEWFALYGGKRDTQTGKRLNHLCYSNQDLFEATVTWAQKQFDVYDYESVSIMPPDAYIAICQCQLCAGKQIDEMGSRGKLSNHVWDFVNRVARRLARPTRAKKLSAAHTGLTPTRQRTLPNWNPTSRWSLLVGGVRETACRNNVSRFNDCGKVGSRKVTVRF